MNIHQYLDQAHEEMKSCQYCEAPLLQDEECDCDPATIAGLLAENKRLRDALQKIIDSASIDMEMKSQGVMTRHIKILAEDALEEERQP